MSTKKTILLLIGVTVTCILVYLFADLKGNISYILERRFIKVGAIILTGILIASATLIFQTITNNRILTPSIIGLDSLYMFLQTSLVFLFGSTTVTMMSKYGQFFLSLLVMSGFALVLFRFMFKRENQNIYLILLIGIVTGTFFQSMSSFMQVLIDPNEFLIIQDKMFASLNNVNGDLLIISWILFAILIYGVWKELPYLDVLKLGRDVAVNLGVDFDLRVKRLFIYIVLFISIATALVGPITFLGLIVVNVTYEVFKTYRHSVLMIGAICISLITLIGGQVLVERVFQFSTTLSVIVNFVGGLYFMYLIVRERKV